MANKLVLALGLVSLFAAAGCSTAPVAPASADLRVCPYLVPYCPPTCTLVGNCPQQCQCPNGSGGHVTLCGASHCGGGDVCCPGTLNADGGVNYVCVHGSVCTF